MDVVKFHSFYKIYILLSMIFGTLKRGGNFSVRAIRINRPDEQRAPVFRHAARTFSLNRLTLVRYLSEYSRDLRRIVDISVIDIST